MLFFLYSISVTLIEFASNQENKIKYLRFKAFKVPDEGNYHQAYLMRCKPLQNALQGYLL